MFAGGPPKAHAQPPSDGLKNDDFCSGVWDQKYTVIPWCDTKERQSVKEMTFTEIVADFIIPA
ncbi:hypothetical protein M7I_5750 [Glarea lozoyensis 74030]|uniref:Uncharacterized protein n=1 Tax=Glarea lozoyensis (strain ATCC 74030 / MF5533) TaxID=1104152 RepID=H0ESQ7_GLAL7|nr:hypothetical protein M7I_5750 [Glarea lozoyensis 74030]